MADAADRADTRRTPSGSSLGVLALVCVLTAGLFTALVTGRHAPQPRSRGIVISRQDCGAGWQHPVPGAQTLTVRNVGSRTATVDLVDSDSGAVYGEVEGLASNTSRPMRVVLGNGTYAFRCAPDGLGVRDGDPVRITGAHRPGQPAVRPVTKTDMLEPLRAYQGYLSRGMRTLVTDTDRLVSAAESGDRSVAERAWVRAHMQYGRLGAAYDAFGDLGEAVDTPADGLPAGVHDPDFTGFHEVEYSLWHGKPMDSVAAQTRALAADVRTLRARLDRMQIQPRDYALRAHEITEDAVRFELAGRHGYGSGSALATVDANLDGTEAALRPLRDLLRDRYPGLSQVDKWLARARSAVRAGRRADGIWTPLRELPVRQRERVNAAMSELAETLAPVAAICTPRRTS